MISGFFITLRIATRALAKNKLRAGLTVLGVVIGIAAVTAMVSLGQSASQLVQGQLQGLGTNVVIVFPGNQKQGGGVHGAVSSLTAADSEAIVEHCHTIIASSPIVITQAQVVYGNANYQPRELVGVGEQFLTVRNWPVRRGGFFTDGDINSASQVCVIGHTVVSKLFQTSDPIGEKIRVKGVPFEVVGVLQTKGANMVGEDQDDVMLFPYTSMRRRLQGSEFDNVNAIMCSARSLTDMAEAESEINQLLAERHKINPGEPFDFDVGTTVEIANLLGVIIGTLTMMISSIAGISLVVGGVGIMNIMLVSVTERTREIGIRMAVGARGRDILAQFLMEAILLACLGGIVGFALGCAASVGVTMLINSLTSGTRWPIVISFNAAILAFFFAAAVGVFFGYYPARRASQLDPIEALRYE
ncbi:ABC transporter permease [Anatilimnocola floriformis]|uniref:ABC transporter permease n=1 Tax=Anatilimnocola floriformis TaxID=2948575 RepID=UPI0020C21BFB|nr:ABC transporter permease [Anatilimnocola floriformis]